MSEAADLVKRLRAIAENDWRISFLAHTSDTANEAADLIVSQEAEIAAYRSAENEPMRLLRTLPPGAIILARDVPGEPRKLAFNALTYLTRRGVLERLGYGKYRRLALSENTDAR